MALVVTMLTHPRWRDALDGPDEAANWLRLLAGSAEDQENHIAARLLDRVAEHRGGEPSVNVA